MAAAFVDLCDEWRATCDCGVVSATCRPALKRKPVAFEVHTEIITRRDDLLIRRLVLEPGEPMAWHTDVCDRFTVVVRGAELTIEYRDTGERVTVPVRAGMADWDAPEARVHRAVNTGPIPYEEVVTFFVATPGLDPQPEAD
jgi:hypothetical protein